MKKVIVFTCSILVFLFSHVFAQTVKIQGTVLDEEGNPIQFATFVIFYSLTDSLITGTITNQAGVFALDNINIGQYNGVISFVGYAPKRISVSVGGNERIMNLGTFRLVPIPIILDGVTIESARDRASQLVDRLVFTLDSEAIRTKPLLSSSLNSIPGVIVDRNAIRVVGSENVLLLVNGVKRSSTYLNLIRSEDVAYVELILNPSSKYDAEYFSVINIVTKRRIPQGFSLNLKADAFTNNIYNFSNAKLTYGIGGLLFNASYQIFYRSSANVETEKYSYLHDPIIANYFSVKNDARRRFQLGQYINYGVDYLIGDNTTLGFSGNLNDYRQDIPTETLGRFYTSDQLNLGTITNQNESSHDHIGKNFSLYFSHNFNRINQKFSFLTNYYTANMLIGNHVRSRSVNKPDQISEYVIGNTKNNNLRVFHFETEYSHPVSNSSKLDVGFVLRRRSFDNTKSVLTSPTKESFLYSGFMRSGFSTFKFTLSPFEFLLGLRVENYSNLINNDVRSNRFHPLPSINILNRINSGLSLQFSYTNRLRYPRHMHLSPFMTFLDSMNVSQGNPFIKPERYHIFNISSLFRHNDNFLNSRLYHKFSNNIINENISLLENNIKFSRWGNHGSHRRTGLVTNFSLSLFNDILSINSSLDIYFDSYRNNYSSWSHFSYEFSLTPELYFANDFVLGVEFYHKGRSAIYQGYVEQTPFFDIFLEKSLFKGKGNLRLGITPFDYSFNYYLKGDNFSLNRTVKERYRHIFLEFVYHFSIGTLRRADTRNRHERDF